MSAPRRVSLAKCPIGLFLYGDSLCLKTEYGNNEGRIDAYIVSSGEFFWGDAPQTIASQRAQLVTPVDARLAAAAHDLYRIVGDLHSLAESLGWSSPLLERVTAVLAKVEGDPE